MRVFQAGRRAIALGAVTVLASVAWPAAAESAAGPTFALKPASPAKLGYFVLRGRPGATFRGKVRVINVGSEAGRTKLYAVDATTGQTSGAVYRSRQEPRRGVGEWTSLKTGAIQLGPGQSRVVPFSVRVPSGASPGQHLGGIVAQRSISTSSSGSATQGADGTFKVRIQELSVIALQVNLPGPRRVKMSLSGIEVGDQPGHQSLLLGIGNPGNVLLKGRGSLKVVNSGGRLVKSQRFDLDTFVPGTHVDFPVYVRGKALRPGRYRGTVTIGYRGRHLTRTFPFAISRDDTRQVFGSQAAQIAPSSSSGGGKTALYLLAGVSVLSAAAAGFFFMRSRGIV
jgi:hypothetical protein